MPSLFTGSNPQVDPLPNVGTTQINHGPDHDGERDSIRAVQQWIRAFVLPILQNGWVTATRIATGAVTDSKIASMAASKPTGQVAVPNGGTGQQSLTSGNILYGRGTGDVGSVSPASLRSALGIRTGVVTFTFSGNAGSSLLTMLGEDPTLGGPGGALLGATMTLAASSVNDVIIREVNADGTDIQYRAERLSGAWTGTVNARYIALVSPGTLS